MLATPTSPNFDCHAPVAGWLSKMIALPFGRSRWVSRYFVLLDSELRYYKDEHFDTPAQILNLREISRVIPAGSSQYPYSFRLEPLEVNETKRSSIQRPSFINNRNSKPWVINCKSELDKQHWMSAISIRIIKYSPLPSPNTPTDELPAHKRSKSDASEDLDNTAIFIVSSDFYRSPTAPLRCINPSTNSKIVSNTKSTISIHNKTITSTSTSLLARRNKKLLPIKISSLTYDFKRDTNARAEDNLSNNCTPLPSPTGAVLDECTMCNSTNPLNYNNSTDTALVKKEEYCCQIPELGDTRSTSTEELSPTYTLYKRKFCL
ncbi:hypothetical protein BDF20DRAFT_847995 [Mycotypha africana]|uniref:uncharacterized protein n=1 Tax=Mycotypha africana TaxID=64632 RepID=UPI002300ACAB|nr:uncharacterized protein BDF20DRAFT_847995 [Mycotypha africana]KAI8992057.1 hypothetical protein BDF20DRAFT_847995 [Mycotypha africana]